MADCSGGGGGLLPHHPPTTLSGDGGGGHIRSRGGGAGAIRPTGLHLVDEGLNGGELLRQVTQVRLEGVKLLVQVVQSLRQWLDPESEKPQRVQLECVKTSWVGASSHRRNLVLSLGPQK